MDPSLGHQQHHGDSPSPSACPLHACIAWNEFDTRTSEPQSRTKLVRVDMGRCAYEPPFESRYKFEQIDYKIIEL